MARFLDEAVNKVYILKTGPCILFQFEPKQHGIHLQRILILGGILMEAPEGECAQS